MGRSRLSLRVVAALALLIVAGACGEVTAPKPASPPLLNTATEGGLVACPSDVAQSATRIIGPFGGTLAVGRTRITVPPGAVLLPTRFTMTLPASEVMEVAITGGAAEHFLFLLPARVSIDYSRCAPENVAEVPLRAWYIDDVTKHLLEAMTSYDDKAARTVTFLTGHLSSYAIAQ